MSGSAYQSVALIMRWLFLLLLLYIILSASFISIKEGRNLSLLRKRAGLTVRWIELREPDEYTGRWIRLEPDDTSIGTGSQCTVTLDESALKSEHAHITTRNGKVILKTKQRFRCRVNGHIPSGRTELSDMDTVCINDVLFICHKLREKEHIQ